MFKNLLKKIQDFKYVKLIIIISTIFIIILGVISYFAIAPIYDTNKIFDFLKKEYDINPIFSTNQKYPIDGGFKAVSQNSVGQYIVLTKFDIIKPVYTIIIDNPATEYFGNVAYQEVRYIELERTGVYTFKVTGDKYSEVRDSNIETVKSLASKYDLTTNFPDKENHKITNYPPLSQDQIDSNRKSREQEQGLASLKARYEEVQKITDKNLKKEKLNELLVVIKEIKVSFDNKKNYSANGVFLEYNQDNLKLLDQTVINLQTEISALN